MKCIQPRNYYGFPMKYECDDPEDEFGWHDAPDPTDDCGETEYKQKGCLHHRAAYTEFQLLVFNTLEDEDRSLCTSSK